MATFREENLPGDIYFTSDTHFGHKLMSRKRDFGESPEDRMSMDKVLINTTNSTVKENDTLFHLGDISFRGKIATAELLEQINCKTIYLIRGNHDYWKKLPRERFKEVHEYAKLKYQGKLIVMMHFPIETWDNRHHGSYHFHGHSHDSGRKSYRRIDVGVDTNPQLRPYHIDELIKLAKEFPLHPEFEDHHKVEET